MAYREFQDDENATRRVWDTYPQTDRHSLAMPGLAGGWLTFEHDTARRRLVPARIGWIEADDAALRRWLLVAIPVTTRTGGPGTPVPIPEVSDQRDRSPRRPSVPPVAADLRTRLARSGETIDMIDRVISRSDPMDDRPPRSDDRPSDPRRGQDSS